jgi:ribosome-binding factor A
MTRRIERVNDLLREELSTLLLRAVKDPRLGHLVSITAVETSPDLKFAKVFISVLGTEEEKREVMEGLSSAAGFLRWEMTGHLRLRRIPHLSFYRDDSIERGSRVLQLLREIDQPGE